MALRALEWLISIQQPLPATSVCSHLSGQSGAFLAAAKLSCALLLTEARPLLCRVLGRARAWLNESSSCSISGSSASGSSTNGRSLTTYSPVIRTLRNPAIYTFFFVPIACAQFSINTSEDLYL